MKNLFSLYLVLIWKEFLYISFMSLTVLSEREEICDAKKLLKSCGILFFFFFGDKAEGFAFTRTQWAGVADKPEISHIWFQVQGTDSFVKDPRERRHVFQPRIPMRMFGQRQSVWTLQDDSQRQRYGGGAPLQQHKCCRSSCERTRAERLLWSWSGPGSELGMDAVCVPLSEHSHPGMCLSQWQRFSSC